MEQKAKAWSSLPAFTLHTEKRSRVIVFLIIHTVLISDST